MAGRGYTDESSYARLRRWDTLSEQWVDHFNQDILVEVVFSEGRTLLLCRAYNSPPSFQSPIDDANITRQSDDVFKISSQRMALQLFFRSTRDADIFQRNLGRLQFRDERRLVMSPNQRQFDRGGPFQPQQLYNQQPLGDQQYGFDRQGSQGQYDQQRYQQQYSGQDQRWDQRQPMAGPGPGARDNNQYNEQPVYQNLPMGGAQPGRDQYGGGAQYGGGGQFEDQNRHQFGRGGAPYGGGGAPYDGGGAQHGRIQGQYDDRGHMYNQQSGMNQGQHGGMQSGAQQGYQQGDPSGRGIQDVPYRPKEAWGDRQNASTQPFNINTATTELAHAINACDLQHAYNVIDRLEKLEKSQRVFNVQLEHFGEVTTPAEEPVKEEEKNEFKLKVAIERQCAPNEISIDIVIKAKENYTIEELVHLFETQYEIPGEVQRWIIKQQLASDKSKWCLKDFQVTKDGGIDQEVYLFVIQGMKERIKQEFLNKRQQQVEDDQRQQQQMEQEENYRKQTQIASNTPDQFGSVMPPPQQQYQQQPFNAPNQGGYMNRAPPPNQVPPQNMGPGFYQDQRPMQAVEQSFRAQPQPQSQQQYHQQKQQQQQWQAYDVGNPGPPRDEYRQMPDRYISDPGPPRHEYRQMPDRYDMPDPGPPRDEYRPKPVDRYDIPDPRPPRDEYQQKLPVRQAEMQPPPAMMQQNNLPRGVAGGVQVFPTMPLQRTQANEQPPIVAPKSFAIGQPEKPRGWNCPVCTFLNEPYRPGCKMCSSSPPEGYEPPADHVPSAEEMKFMQ